jgi:F-type H+-transporting ATPase subunit delta
VSGTSPVARRYAKAVFSLAQEQNAIDQITSEVRQVGDVVNGSPDLRAALSNPTVAPPVRKAIMTEILSRMGVSGTVRNAVLLITDHGRAASLPHIADALAQLADERAGRLRAEVTSAAALTEAQYQRVAAALERITGRKISLARNVDPTLIGGVVTRIGDKVYDGSVKSRIAELRASLLPS